MPPLETQLESILDGLTAQGKKFKVFSENKDTYYDYYTWIKEDVRKVEKFGWRVIRFTEDNKVELERM